MNREDITRKINTAPATQVLKGTIITGVVNSDDGQISTAGQLGYVGVTIEKSDPKGYVGLQSFGEIMGRAGAAIQRHQLLASDATGRFVPFTPLGAGAAKQVLGYALANANNAEDLVRVMLMPTLALG
jgi:hypothetical protein